MVRGMHHTPRSLRPLAVVAVVLCEPLVQAASVLLTFGAFVVWGVLPRVDHSAVRLDHGAATVPGVVTASRLATPVWGPRDSPWVATFRFATRTGAQVDAECLVLRQPVVGSSVLVQYLPDEPSIARVGGGRLGACDPVEQAAIVEPLLGIIVLIAGLGQGALKCCALRSGGYAAGARSARRGAGGRRYADCCYRYCTPDGDERSVTLVMRRTWIARHPTVSVLCWHGAVAVVEALPVLPAPGERGCGFRANTEPRAWFLVVLPLIALAAHVTAALTWGTHVVL